MKISKYTCCFAYHKNDCVLFNTLSNALIGVDRESFAYLKKCQREHLDIDADHIGADFYSILEDKHLIVDNDADEVLLHKSFVQNMRMDRTSMHLTIAPTMDCIFRCHYCFEQHKNHSYMTSETIDAIIRHVTEQKELKHINLTWFGGEPLMAIPQMVEFYKKLKSKFPHKIVSNIITTGFHLSEETIEILKSIDIGSVQITLDGNKESHNKIKYTKECKDVFSKIIENLDRLTTLAPEINIMIRVNLTKQNQEEYVKLYDFIYRRYLNKKVSVAPAFVMNRHAGHSNTEGAIYFTRKEATEFVLNLFYKYRIHSPWLRYPQTSCNECAIRNFNALSFDAEGYAYKCWEIIGNKKYAIGKISHDGLVDINTVMLNRQLYGADPLCDEKCLKCKLLPICYGGCPIQRIQNEYDGYHNEICTPYKGHLSDFIKIHLALKKAGYENY